MRTAGNLSSYLMRALLLGAVLLLPRVALAQPFSVACNTGGDQLGFSIATNGDFNGDGVNDIAVGSPCFHVRIFPRAGRVIVIDGKTGKVLTQRKGAQAGQWFGAAVGFLPDLNGDGRSELAVGSPGYDVTPYDQKDPLKTTLESGGRVDVFTYRRRRFRTFGTSPNSGFGEKIVATSDINGDRRLDFLVSASTDSKPGGRSQAGRVWLVSGRNGDLLGYRVGEKPGKNYGRALAATDDLDNDGLKDFLTGSDEENIPNVFNGGSIDAVSTAHIDAVEPLLQVTGAEGDRLGKTVDYAGDIDDDKVPEFIVGARGADDNGITKAGLVTLFDMQGRRHWVRQDSQVQDAAGFGDAVATIGDIDGDKITDFLASAPNFDIFVNKKTQADAGRVVALSGVDGDPIWSVNGDHRDNRFGYALAGKIDYNLDEVPDAVVGTPGDGPFGRRGAGSVRILSGVDGRELLRVAGRRGLETRLVTATPISSNKAHLRSFTRSGRGQVLDTDALVGIKLGELDVTILNDRTNPRPRVVQAAVTAGYGSTDSTVEVYRMGTRSEMVDKFKAFSGLNSGADCEAGEVNDEPFEELVCAQATTPNHNVKVRVFRRLDEQQPFFPTAEFPVFASTDLLNPLVPINANGANLAIGDVTGDNAEEIVVGTNRGVPLVKIFSNTGVFIRSFLAYDPAASSGVDVAIIRPQDGGENRIVTAPRQGEALIKLFTGDGERVLSGRDNVPVGINIRPSPYKGGARVAAADIDLDDSQEMIALLPDPPLVPQVFAYELTNLPVLKFTPFIPLPFNQVKGGAIAATDHFVRD